jgi:DNA-binding NtrC family response regulator
MGDSGRVLLVGQDRRFRAVASALLTRRDYSVAVGDGSEDIAELASREGPDVVVIDATASLTALARDVARLETLRPRVGVVVVSSDPRDRITALPVIAKWSAFDVLLEAIKRARPNNG